MRATRNYGLMAEFDSASDLVAAADRTREAGYQKIDAYSPFPVEGLAEAIGFHLDLVPLITLIGGIVGGDFGIPDAVVDVASRATRSTSAASLTTPGPRSSPSPSK